MSNGLLLAAAPDLRDLLIEALEELDIRGRTDHADIYHRACAALDVEDSPNIILTR